MWKRAMRHEVPKMPVCGRLTGCGSAAARLPRSGIMRAPSAASACYAPFVTHLSSDRSLARTEIVAIPY